MTRRRYSRSRSRRKQYLRLSSAESALFIVGAILYVIGLFGAFNLLAMPTSTAILLLALGGGMQLVLTLTLLF